MTREDLSERCFSGSGFGPIVFLPGSELRNDRFLGADDLEGPDGGHRKRIADCGGAEWQYGTGFSSVSLVGNRTCF